MVWGSISHNSAQDPLQNGEGLGFGVVLGFRVWGVLRVRVLGFRVRGSFRSCRVSGYGLPSRFGSFRKLGVPYLGVLIIRILLFRVLY